MILRRHGDNVGRRALQHGDVRRRLRHFGHQGHGGRAAANHHHALVRVCDVLGPLLRMDNLSLELLSPGKLRGIPPVVVVVAAAHEEKVAGEAAGFGRVGPLGLYSPACLGG